MSNRATAQPAADSASPVPSFTPVPVRPRHDGWSPDKQVAFLRALAETACVDEACRRVGMSQQSAYTLRNRTDATSFRQAWVIALDRGTAKLSDQAMARAMHGVAVPIFYKGEQVGERRVFNERLTMFLLRAHDPERYGAWRDRLTQVRDDPDGGAALFGEAIRRVAEDAVTDQLGRSRVKRPPLLAYRLDSGAPDRDAAYDAMTHRYAAMFSEQEREIERLRAAKERSPGNGG